MKFTVNCDCTPEEARTFLGLPDLSPVHDKYIQSMMSAMDGAGSLDQMGKMLGAFAPMGDASMKLFSQMMDIGLSGAKGSSKS
ncbi:MAG: DUF6489 family protein [Sphingomonadaceae bacterium]|jgi:hypothetical protein